MRRRWIPARLTGALGKTLLRWQDLFDLLDEHPLLLDGVRTSDLLVKREGRPRNTGEWALPLLAYVNSGERELRPWHTCTPDELWTRAGFSARPGYDATYKNFAALEAHEGAFRTVASRLIQLAVEKSGGKVGHAVHVDGTEAETHSRLIHDCTGSELATCHKQTLTPRRSTNADAREERHHLATMEPNDDALHGAAEEMAADERGLRVLVGGCWYRLSDDEAGVRAYITSDGKVKRFWSGYYNAKAVDHYTGGVLASYVTSASVQEQVAYPELYAQIKEHIGQAPRAVVADRGYSVSSVFEMHTRDGVASVIPWRQHWRQEKRIDHERFDRHGIPHCRSCGGEGAFHRFQHDAGPQEEPRLWFRCAMPTKADCEKVQSIQCKEHWRLLVPLWRTDPAYQVLRFSHTSYESAHDRWRERYAVAGDTRADRPKRRGLGVQQLRASVALVIEWLTICHRQGWLGGPVLNEREETVVSQADADRSCRRLIERRQALGLACLVDATKMPEHQHEIAASYGSASVFGPGSAYGDEIGSMLAQDAALAAIEPPGGAVAADDGLDDLDDAG